MALINCPECGRENVSDSAVACPGCGYGVKAHFERIKQEEEEKRKKEEQEKEEIEQIEMVQRMCDSLSKINKSSHQPEFYNDDEFNQDYF